MTLGLDFYFRSGSKGLEVGGWHLDEVQALNEPLARFLDDLTLYVLYWGLEGVVWLPGTICRI